MTSLSPNSGLALRLRRLANAVVVAATLSPAGCTLFQPPYSEYEQQPPGTSAGSGTSGSGGATLSTAGSSPGGESSVGGSATMPTAGNAGSSGIGGDGGCAAETCNGADDDCDGVIDNGCPTSLAPGSATLETPLGDSDGGSSFSTLCKAGEVIVGLKLNFSGWLNQVTAICQPLALQADKQTAPYTYSIAFGADHVLPSHPATADGSAQDLNCAPGQVLVGITLDDQQLDPTTVVVTRLSETCAEPYIALDGTTPGIHWKNPMNAGPIKGDSYAATDAEHPFLLSTDQLAVGIDGNAGSWVDRLGLASGKIAVKVIN